MAHHLFRAISCPAPGTANRVRDSRRRRSLVEEVVAVPMWLIFAIVISVFLLVMLGLAFAWSKWMTRSED